MRPSVDNEGYRAKKISLYKFYNDRFAIHFWELEPDTASYTLSRKRYFRSL